MEKEIETVEEAICMYRSDKVWENMAAASSPLLPIELMHEMVNDPDRSRSAISMLMYNPNCPADILNKVITQVEHEPGGSVAEIAGIIVKSFMHDTMRGALRHPNCPVEHLVKFSADRNEYTRNSVAFNPSTPPDVIDRLMQDESESVAKGLAGNTNLSLEYMELLSRHRLHTIRAIIARNPSTPEKILLRLYKDRSKEVKKQVTMNPNCPTEIKNLLEIKQTLSQ
jgi:hypothetical protein